MISMGGFASMNQLDDRDPYFGTDILGEEATFVM